MAASEALAPDDMVSELSYHCVLYDIPFDLAVPQIVEHIIPAAEAGFMKEMDVPQVKLVSRQLRVYKEQLDTKFGFFDYVILSAVPLGLPEKSRVHRLVVDWIKHGLTSSLQSVGCKVRIAQPPHCHSAGEFLDLLDQQCKILTPEYSEDPLKIQTFLLSRVDFIEEGECDTFSDAVGGDAVATFSVSSLTPKEIIWLKRALLKFPPVLVANGNLSTARADQKRLLAFFHQALAPLIRVSVSSVSDEVEICEEDGGRERGS